jgi:cytidine deaminase
MKIKRLAVVCLGNEFPPCGACRQVIAEFALSDGRTQIMFRQNGNAVTRTIAELLPDQFALSI